MNFPDLTCHDCDAVLDIDGDDDLCNYTGRACAPGGCDCGTQRTTRCPECEREHDAEVEHARDDWASINSAITATNATARHGWSFA